MEKTGERALFGVSIGHAAHDTWFGLTPILLASLSSQMGISNSDIGLMLLSYQGISAIVQPFFGRLSERVGGRPLAIGSILWTTSLFSIALFVNSKLALMILIALAGFGSGAWHPQGAANATISGGKRWGATAMSIFSLGGILGTAFLGAALGGYLLEAYGRRSLLLISAITVGLALTIVRRTVPRWIAVPEKAPSQATRGQNGVAEGVFRRLLIFLLLGIAFRSLANNSLSAYIPKHLQDIGVSSATYGFVLSLFLAASALGGVVGSYVADRMGLERILVGSTLLTFGALLAFLRLEGVWSYVLLIVAGFFMGPAHTLFIVAGQRRFPQRMAMVSGAFMGFTFISGGVGTWLLGLLADRVGLGTTLGILPWAVLASALCAFFSIPRTAVQRPSKEVESATACGEETL